MNSEIFYKKKIKKSRSSIIMKIGKEIRKTLRFEPIKINSFHFEKDTQADCDAFLNTNLQF